MRWWLFLKADSGLLKSPEWLRFLQDIGRWRCWRGCCLPQILMLAVQIKRDSRGR